MIYLGTLQSLNELEVFCGKWMRTEYSVLGPNLSKVEVMTIFGWKPVPLGTTVNKDANGVLSVEETK